MHGAHKLETNAAMHATVEQDASAQPEGLIFDIKAVLFECQMTKSVLYRVRDNMPHQGCEDIAGINNLRETAYLQ